MRPASLAGDKVTLAVQRKQGGKWRKATSLRHTHATPLRANVATKVVSERLGHASTSITSDIYSHVTPDMQEAAVEKLDAALAAAVGGLAQKGLSFNRWAPFVQTWRREEESVAA